MHLTVNGQSHTIESALHTRLSDVLRDELKLTGTKVGCNAGDCGACTVLINGEQACACLVAVGQLNNSAVETIESLSHGEAPSPLQKSFLAHGAAQCGICTPGMLMAATSLLRKNPSPSKAEVEDSLGGVLCRCTGYTKIIDAVLNADTSSIVTDPSLGHAVGSAIIRLDGVPKVNGTERYGADEVPAGALHLTIIRSPHHRARFTIGDTTSFVTNKPGIEHVFTAQDIPGKKHFGVIPAFIDQPVFAETETAFKGEAVAAVVGTAEAIAAFNPVSFPITWEPLPAVLHPAEALAEQSHFIQQGRPRNTLVEGRVERGNTSQGFAEAAHIIEEHITTPFIEHAYIEPEAGYAVRTGEKLTIFGCTQAPVMDRDSIADIMDLPRESIRILPSACGGGFGSKLDLSFQPYIALAAWKLNRPVAIAYSRSESMQSTTKRHPSNITIKVGCSHEGKITATEFDGTFNTGAYSSWGPTVANRVPVHASGPYLTPNYRAQSHAVLTNCAPSGAFRGFGVPQSMIALECALDLLAERAGIDQLEFRLKNALRNGQPTVTGQTFERGVGIVECLEALRPAWEKAKHHTPSVGHLRKGFGLATCWYGCGNTSLPNPSTIRIGITPESKINLHQGAIDIGQGSNTVISQIAADAIGVPVHALTLIGPDTAITPDAGKTSASRQTFVSGNAAKKSGEALRAQILRQANLGPEAKIELTDGAIKVSNGSNNCQLNLASLPVNPHGYVIMAEETYDPPTKPLDGKGQGDPYAVYGYGAQLVELTVDTKLGTVKLDRITAAHDVGRAINPQLVEGQIEGGIAQGIGMALMENYIPGRTENLHDYLIPTFGDMPVIDSIIVEVEDPHGPYGAKGLGEHVLIPTAPAILNAIRNATGAIVRHLPATPDKVLAAIKEAEKA
jgi:aldehyde oxidoreductase